MITDRKAVDAVQAFADSYEPDPAVDHPDLHSRVVMFRRAVEGGDDRHVQAHARSMVRFMEQVGIDPAGDVKPYAKWRKADLEAEVENRNTDPGRSDANLIVVEGRGTRADLAAALDADDAARS